MKIVMAVSESLPYCKTGGLADVSYSLSKELVHVGHDVSIFLPLYDTYRNKVKLPKKAACRVEVPMSWRREYANVYETSSDGISFYLVENRQYFERGHIYGDNDDGERFAFFSLAVLYAMRAMKMKPEILHVHDWQPGMIPCLCKESDEFKDYFKDTKHVLTIHNPAFQGILDKMALGNLYNLPDQLYYDGKVRLNEMVSTLKSGIIYADKITTVSPTHHLELLTSENGMGLEGSLCLREYDFTGILNGIDYKEFAPRYDKLIPNCFSKTDFLEKKDLNKKALYEKLGMKYSDGPLYSMVSRLTSQKGMDLVFKASELLLQKGAKIVILGSGEPQYEERLKALKNAYPDDVGIYVGYSNELAHSIYGSSDFFLMPSLFEPCGLSQMISERYGTLPIVRRVGGLYDSVICYDGNNEKVANGFGFIPFTEQAMNETCLKTVEVYQDKKLYTLLALNAMNTDNSWKKSTEEYLNVYKTLITD